PFDDAGQIDVGRFRRLVEFQVAQGVTGVLPCGTTGESPTLTWKEHDDIVHLALETVGDRCGVLAGTGSNNTAEAIRGTKDALETGASAVLLVDCYYNGPSSLELRTRYYEQVLEAVPDIPIVPYVIPGRSGCALGAEDLALLHQRDPKRVPAVKRATGDLDRMRYDRDLAGESLAILSGDDDLTLAMMADSHIAASGVVSVMSNLVPKALSEMIAAQAAGDVSRAGEIANQVGPFLKLVGCRARSTRTLPDGRSIEVEDKFRNPVPLKTMMAGLGMIDGFCRDPLGKMTKPAVEICRDAVRHVWETAPEVLRPLEEAFDVNVEARLADDGLWSALTA
ncbi:MAG TPA: 4-hydroxy-tetrahydrodipicolinate synthase, partial [Polyangiaceae bacterium LLY-WYZ-15_(1-7)]|nr:4-hydroxy-tetrahydrodipicolinate synthase [Polyangiaceae bacterium LLY-WYZ-15_(1-7)]